MSNWVVSTVWQLLILRIWYLLVNNGCFNLERVPASYNAITSFNNASALIYSLYNKSVIGNVFIFIQLFKTKLKSGQKENKELMGSICLQSETILSQNVYHGSVDTCLLINNTVFFLMIYISAIKIELRLSLSTGIFLKLSIGLLVAKLGALGF